MGLFSALFGGKKNGRNLQSGAEEDLLQDLEVASGIILPKVLAEYWPALSKAKKTYISITATPAETFTLQQSKLLHFPCIPKDFPYPVDRAGKYMLPLGQINFSECPNLEGFPVSGYLQFYIAGNEIYGLDFDDQQTQSDFRVLYFKDEEVADPHQDFSFLADTINTEYAPVFKSHQLSFQLKEEYLGLGDYHCDQIIGSIITNIYERYPVIEDRLSDILYDRFLSNGHKLGGYAYFTQEVGHFKFVKGMSMMIPDIIPYKKIIVYATGIIEIGAGICLLFDPTRSAASWFLIVFFMLILPANISAAYRHIDHEKGTYEGKGKAYLWFRIPLQFFFIIWIYISSIYS